MVLFCGEECQRSYWDDNHSKTCIPKNKFALVKIYQAILNSAAAAATDDTDRSSLQLLCGSVLQEPSERNCDIVKRQLGDDGVHFGFMHRYIADKSSVKDLKYGTLLNNNQFIKSFLGSGVYSNVYEIANKENKVVAMKITKKSTDEIPAEFYHDIEVRNINHPNVIGSCYAGTMVDEKYTEKEYFMMFMDKAKMDLGSFINKTFDDIGSQSMNLKKLPREYADADGDSVATEIKLDIDRSYDNLVLCAYQCALGLGYINTRHMVATNDFKPENVLVYGLDATSLVKEEKKGEENDKKKYIIPICSITDFGVSRPYITTLSEDDILYSLWSRSPEALLGDDRLSMQNEIWALGCTIFTILTGRNVFTGNDPTDQLDVIFTAFGTPTDDTPPTTNPLFSNINQRTWEIYKSRRAYRKKPIPATNMFDTKPSPVENFAPEAADLLKGMLVLDPSKRFTIYDVIDHPFFTQTKLRYTRLGNTASDVIKNLIPEAQFKRILEFVKFSPTTTTTTATGISPKLNHGSVILAYAALEHPLPPTTPSVVVDENIAFTDVDIKKAHARVIDIITRMWVVLRYTSNSQTASSKARKDILDGSVASFAVDIVQHFFGKYQWKRREEKRGIYSSKTRKPPALTHNNDIDISSIAIAAMMIALKYASLRGDTTYSYLVTIPKLPYSREVLKTISKTAEWEIATTLDFDIHRPCAYIYAYELLQMCLETIGEHALVSGISNDIIMYLILAIAGIIGVVKYFTPIYIAELAIASCILPGNVLIDPWKNSVGLNSGFDTIAVSDAIYGIFLRQESIYSISAKHKEVLNLIVVNARK